MALISSLAPIVGILTIAAITPGPNNLLVFNAAVQSGFKAAAYAIAGVICGSFLLLGLLTVGFSILGQYNIYMMKVISVLGSSYLVFVGTKLCRTSLVDEYQSATGSIIPNTFIGTVLFQVLNPKSWVLMSIVYTAVLPQFGWVGLLILVTAVFTGCLTVWAYAGSFVSTYILQGSRLHFFNLFMGVALILCAAILLKQGIS